MHPRKAGQPTEELNLPELNELNLFSLLAIKTLQNSLLLENQIDGDKRQKGYSFLAKNILNKEGNFDLEGRRCSKYIALTFHQFFHILCGYTFY